MNYSDKLRQLADYLDERPELLDRLTEWDYPYVSVVARDAVEFGQLVSIMGEGEKRREGDGLCFQVRPVATPYEVIYGITAWVTGVCKRKPTGRKTQRKVHVPKDAIQTEDGAWIVEDEEYEYECPPSFLGLAGK